jgi:LmbE family N-acetylglucosaminyl deacetylase
MRILGFGAHPDDVEIFFFGTLASAKAGGAEIGWAIATDGSKGGTDPPDELRAIRRREAKAAGALLHIEPIFVDFVDGELTTGREAAARIEAALLAFAPDLVITHAPNDYHPDHRALSVLVRDAARFRAPVVYSDTLMGVGFQPTMTVDTTAHVDLKRRAIRCHASQRPERFVEACEVWNRFRALQCNAPTAYAEAFRFEPVYPFADVRALLPAAPPPRALDVVRHSDGGSSA